MHFHVVCIQCIYNIHTLLSISAAKATVSFDICKNLFLSLLELNFGGEKKVNMLGYQIRYLEIQNEQKKTKRTSAMSSRPTPFPDDPWMPPSTLPLPLVVLHVLRPSGWLVQSLGQRPVEGEGENQSGRRDEKIK